jgi:hypothetical protein
MFGEGSGCSDGIFKKGARSPGQNGKIHLVVMINFLRVKPFDPISFSLMTPPPV